jgi:hypothetical protein
MVNIISWVLFGAGLIVGGIVGGGAVFLQRWWMEWWKLRYSDKEKKIFTASIQIGTWVCIFAVLGDVALAIGCSGLSDSKLSTFASAFGLDLLLGFAAAGVGALAGFIFGIPRTPDPASRAAVATVASQAGPAEKSHALLAANTNLERISDWLTTLLIGATLVQFKSIVTWITGLGSAFIKIDNSTIIPAVIIYFFVLSFLGVYLITRLYLTTALAETLGLLTGSTGVSEAAVLKARLDRALAISDPNELAAALETMAQWKYEDEDEASDPSLNASVTRVLLHYIASGKPTNLPALEESAKSAVTKAASDSTIKAQLLAELSKGMLTSGDPNLDADLKSRLS